MSRADGDSFLSWVFVRVLLCVCLVCWEILDIFDLEKLGDVNAADDYVFAVA
jgi:hypothetical protein